MRVPSNEATLDTLSHDVTEGVVASYHTFLLDVPANYFLRKEPGTILTFNVADEEFAELALTATNMNILAVEDGRATLEMTVASGYVRILLSDLKKVKDVYILLDDEGTTTTQEITNEE